MAKSRIGPIHPGVYLKAGISTHSLSYWLHLQSRYDIDVAEDLVSSRVIREVRRDPKLLLKGRSFLFRQCELLLAFHWFTFSRCEYHR